MINDMWAETLNVLWIASCVKPAWSVNAKLIRREKRILTVCYHAIYQMSDSGLDEIEYLSHIKQLRYNYTTFDIHKLSIRAQRRVMEIISKRASDLPRYIARPLDFHDHFICRIYSKVFRNTCYNLIQSYALAARNCKNLKATDGDR